MSHATPPPIPLQVRSRASGTLITMTLVSIAAAAGIGYYAWNLRETSLQTHTALVDARTLAASATSETEKRTAAESELRTCREERKQNADRCHAAEKNAMSIQGNLEATRADLEELRKQRAEAANRLSAFKKLTGKFAKMIDRGKLDVGVRQGRMSVKLPAGVLFSSGKAELSRDGELALMEVAIVLRDLKHHRFMVAGHTDSRPLEASENSRYRNNWELSTARAVTVTQFLVEARMAPNNLVAAGYGQFDPIGDNKTRAGRQENRRIEIVLLPNIEEIPAIPAEMTSGTK